MRKPVGLWVEGSDFLIFRMSVYKVDTVCYHMFTM